MNRDSITLPMFRTLPSSLFPRKGTLAPIPTDSLELGAGMVLPHKPRCLHDIPSAVEEERFIQFSFSFHL